MVNRIIILIATSLPGVQKMLILSFVGLFYGTMTLGTFVNDTFIVYMAVIFTSLNWSGVLLVDLNRYPQNLHTKLFGKIISYSIFYVLLATPFFFLLWHYNLIVDLYGSLFFLLSFSLYQVWRHYCLAQHKYREIVIQDILIVFLSLLLVWINTFLSLSVVGLLALPFLSPIFHFIHINRGIVIFSTSFYRNKLNLNMHKRALQRAISNFSTGSLPLLIAPLSYNLLSNEYTAVIGFFSNIATSMILLPRAISFHKLPYLSKQYNNKQVFTLEFRKYEKSILLVLVALFLVMTFLYSIFSQVNKKFPIYPSFNLPYLAWICYLMMATAVISQIMLPMSNKLMILRREDLLLKINAFTFFMTLVSFFLFNDIIQQVFWVIIAFQLIQIKMHLFRLIILRRIDT